MWNFWLFYGLQTKLFTLKFEINFHWSCDWQVKIDWKIQKARIYWIKRALRNWKKIWIIYWIEPSHVDTLNNENWYDSR